ncbi:hypothetical protein NDU88_006646 [Pleurodeles waltl]|uniref:Secreted protein n=1 Tax=Pleurodeles waltl TaxID=8319 RepID=A0AAV7RSL6_PLEWA|nr:hypothetical protein NDU88_006646 [Pleurodeles waltl]
MRRGRHRSVLILCLFRGPCGGARPEVVVRWGGSRQRHALGSVVARCEQGRGDPVALRRIGMVDFRPLCGGGRGSRGSTADCAGLAWH